MTINQADQLSKELKPRKRFHWRQINGSEKMQRVLRYMMDGYEHTTLDIIQGAGVCAVNSYMAELGPQGNGFNYRCRQVGRVWKYHLTADGIAKAKEFFSQQNG